MSKTTKYIQQKAMENIPGPALDVFGKAVLVAVDKAVKSRWDDALRIAAEAEGTTVEAKVSSILRRFKRELTAVGAATGAVAASPGLGTAAAASALAADMAWFGMRATDLIMAIGAVHGHTESTMEERRAWVLAVLAFGDDAGKQFKSLLREVDGSLVPVGDQVGGKAAGLFGGDAATVEALRRLNTTLASQVATKYGTRRSVLAVGKLLPFGIGAVVGGTANYTFVRVVGKQANRFFERTDKLLPPGTRLIRPPSPSTDGGSSEASAKPPPPTPKSARHPNPEVELSTRDRRNAIPTDGREKEG
jgi:hypothetical protein